MSSENNRSRSSSTTSAKSDASVGPNVKLYGQTDFHDMVVQARSPGLQNALVKGAQTRRNKVLGIKGARRRHKKTQKRKQHRKTSHRRK